MSAEYSNTESAIPTGRNTSLQDQTSSHDVINNSTLCTNSNEISQYNNNLSQNNSLPIHTTLSVRYPQESPDKLKETKVTPGIDCQGVAGKKLVDSKYPIILLHDIRSQLTQPSNNHHFHHTALNQGTQKRNIPNHQTVNPDISKRRKRHPDFESNMSPVIQNPSNVSNQSGQISNFSSAYQNRPVMPTQNAPVPRTFEAEWMKYVPISQSGMINTSFSTAEHTQSAEQSDFANLSAGYATHSDQDSSMPEMILDGSSGATFIEVSAVSERSTENETTIISKSPDENQLSVESSMIEGLPTFDVPLMQGAESDVQTRCTEIKSEEMFTVNNSSSDQADQSVVSITQRADIWADQLTEIFMRMKSDFSQTCKIAGELHKSLVQSANVIERLASASENLKKIKNSSATAVTSKDVTTEAQKMAEEKLLEKKNSENSDADIQEDRKKNKKNRRNKLQYKRYDSDDDYNVEEDDDKTNTDESISDDTEEDTDKEDPKTMRGHIRSFTLPPEYDPDDTRWTLKYRKNDPKLGLVELVPKSNVFINYIRLKHCHRVAKDSKALARMLMVELFTQQALSVCSLTGAKANAFDGTVRPGLDENARVTMMSYVEDYTRQQNWGVFEIQSVTNSIRSKLQEIRSRHGQTA